MIVSKHSVAPSGNERRLDEAEMIVSKTDLQGRITYANESFCRVGLYDEVDLIGQPHSIVRHPDMPRCVFHLLWQHIRAGKEIFAYLKNLAKNGDHYWVLATFEPRFDVAGEPIGVHSCQRVPDASAIAVVEPLYRKLRDEESRHADPQKAMESGAAMLARFLQAKNMDYEEFVLTTLAAAA